MAQSLVLKTLKVPDELQMWVAETLDTQFNRIELHRPGQGGGSSKVMQWLPDIISKIGGPEAFSQMIQHRAQVLTDGSRARTPQMFSILSCPDESAGHASRMDWLVYPKAGNLAKGGVLGSNPIDLLEDDGENTPGSVLAFLQQTQRHTEASYRIGLIGAQHALTSLSAQNERLTQQCEQMAAREARVMEAFERVMDRAVEREEEREERASNRALKKMALEMGLSMLPMILQKFSKDDGAVDLLDQMLAGLGEDQIGALLSSLTEQQQQQFKVLYGIIRERKQKAEGLASTIAAMKAQADAEAAEASKRKK